ncbi:MAG: hypothetical protein AAGH15_08010 [Myxococcota bacterium]
MNVLVRLLALVMVGCSTTTVVPGASDGPGADAGTSEAGTPDMPAAEAGPEDAGVDLRPPPEPLTLRITDAALVPLEAEIRVATAMGTRTARGDRVTLTSEELAARADVVVAAPGFATFGLSTFQPADYAALPEVGGAPAIALVPRLITDPLEVEVRGRGQAYVTTDPLGYGGGFAFGARTTDVQRDPAVRALLIEGPEEAPCPRRLPVPDLSTLEGPLVIDLESTEFEDVPCIERTLEVVSPPGTALRSMQALFERPYEVTAYGWGRSGTASSRLRGLVQSRPEMDTNVRSFALRILPDSISMRDHPALDLSRAPIIVADYLFEVPGPVTRSRARFESLEAMPERVVLPEPEPEATPSLLMGLDVDPESEGFPTLTSLPEAVEIVPPPEPGRSVFLSLAGSGVLLPPGGAVLPARRLITEVHALSGPDAVLGTGDDDGLLLVGVGTATYEPFATRRDAAFAEALFNDRRAPIVIIPRELLTTE